MQNIHLTRAAQCSQQHNPSASLSLVNNGFFARIFIYIDLYICIKQYNHSYKESIIQFHPFLKYAGHHHGAQHILDTQFPDPFPIFQAFFIILFPNLKTP